MGIERDCSWGEPEGFFTTADLGFSPPSTETLSQIAMATLEGVQEAARAESQNRGTCKF